MDRPLIMITGSNGFIGTALQRELGREFQVIGLDREPPPERAGATWIEVDVTSDESVGSALRRVRHDFGGRIASVLHLAAYYDFSGEPSDLYDQVTVRGTQRLLRMLHKAELSVEQFVFSSTMLVHAPCVPGQHIDEEWPLEPKWDYPRSKLEAENLILGHPNGMPTVLLRIAGVYNEDCHSVPIAQQIQRVHERRLTAKVFPGDVSTGQSFVHLDDLVAAFRRVVTRRASLPRHWAILIGEPEPLSYDELQRMLGWLIHGEEWETTRIPKSVAKAGAWVQDQIPGIEEPFIKPWMIDLADDHYALDITRARKLLDWKPEKTLRETIPRMVDLLKSNPERFYEINKLAGTPPPPATAPAMVKPGC